jgi:hypothetical protein
MAIPRKPLPRVKRTKSRSEQTSDKFRKYRAREAAIKEATKRMGRKAKPQATMFGTKLK